MFGDRLCCHEWEQGCHWYLRMLTMLQCTEQPHNKAQNINSAKVGKTRIQMAQEKFRLSVSSLLRSFLPPWKYAVWLHRSSSKVFLTSHTFQHRRCSWSSTTPLMHLLLYSHLLLPNRSFFSLPQATPFPDSLCLRGHYLPHKQQSSFV